VGNFSSNINLIRMKLREWDGNDAAFLYCIIMDILDTLDTLDSLDEGIPDD